MEDNTSGSPQLNGREIPKNNPNGFAVPSDGKQIFSLFKQRETKTFTLRTTHTSHILHML